MSEAVKQVQQATQAHYDRWSYDFETSEHADMQLEGSLLGRALRELPPDGIAVDAGCGTGLVTRLLRRHSAAKTVIGLDLSSGSLRRARAATAGAAFVQGDILRLPLRPDAADLVLSRGVIMTTGDPERAVKQLASATRPGGRLYLRVYNRNNIYRTVYEVGGPICRGIASLPGGVPFLALLVVPPFWLALQLAVLLLRRPPLRMSWGVLWNAFADQLLVPHNSFHTLDELKGWGQSAGFKVLGEGTITLGQQIEALFEKPASPSS